MSFKKKMINVLVILFLTFATGCLSVLLYIRQMWPNADYEQLLITINDLSFGTITASTSFRDYLFAFSFFVIFYPLCYFFLNIKQQFFAAVFLILSSLFLSGFLSYHYYKNTTSTLFEDEYVYPQNINYTFPLKKRNLILIYLESFEQNFSSEKYYEKNLIPHLTKLQEEGTYSLAHHDISGTGFSIASLVSSQCGIPLRYLPNRDIYAMKYFLPKAVCFPEILKENGYQTAIIKAADITFTNAHIFAKSHGYDEASGVDEILSKYPKEEHKLLKGAFGGVNDKTLFSYAKERLKEFSPDKPFMLTLFSLDTHTPSAYRDLTCQNTFGDIRDVFMCTDKTVYDFVEWLKQSPYWENTTVVILGDHLLPVKIKTKGLPKRGIFNVFLNLPPHLKINPKKTFSTFDMAPSILESLGITISPRAFGLGRSLFSHQQTLLEKIGFQKFKVNLLQNSLIYNNFNEPEHQRGNVFSSYIMGTTIENGDLPKFTDAYEEFFGVYYVDRLNLKISENTKNNIHVTMRFRAISDNKNKIYIMANGHDVFTFTPSLTQENPYVVSFDIPFDIVSDGKIQLSFRNTFGIKTPMQIGIAPLDIKLTDK